MGGPEVLIYEDAFLQNFRELQTRAAGLALMPVLKANAYGHSAEIIAKLCEAHLSEAEVPYLLVARVGEARALRRAGIKRPLLVLSEFSGDDLTL